MKLSSILAPALLATAVAAQNAATPAPTTPCPVIPGWEKTTPTPASSTPCPVIPGWEKCTEVSVEGDATYCIEGPVCSGSGTAPAGDKCPKKGDVAKKDCLQNLKSYADAGKCVAPIDAQCVKIKTGAWGCVFSAIPTTPAPTTPCPVIPGWEKNTLAPSPVPTTPCPVIPGWEKATPAPSVAAAPVATPAPTTAAPVATPAPTTAAPVATPAPTTAAPVANPAPTTAAPVATPAPTTAIPVVVATTQSFAATETETETKGSSNNAPVVGAIAGLVAAVAIAGVVVYKKRAHAPLISGSSPSSPTIYSGAVNTPV
ncbi:hypothetical protein FI667_g8264, partial [Globisporangium splendens]